MATTVRSFAKINLGLRIGPLRPDGFHELRTVYQTIRLHDVLTLTVKRGSGIEILCSDPRVPKDESNTCYRIANLAIPALKANGRVVIHIEKRLPVQGGLGGASSNAVAVLLALEKELDRKLSGENKLRIAAQVGSDLPLFLVGGTVIGVGRGEEVYPVPDLPGTPCVVALPEAAVSTPRAFADWDRSESAKLTHSRASDRMLKFGHAVSAWLGGFSEHKAGRLSGVPARGRGRVENPLLDLVHTGIENDFEQVVFPQYPELRQVKSALLSAGAFYASLSGSGSAVYGLFRSRTAAEAAAVRLQKNGFTALATSTITRGECRRKFLVSSL
jgi:4-diphosphocytidyl-2-C-methyl-D-erythritol kinase